VEIKIAAMRKDAKGKLQKMCEVEHFSQIVFVTTGKSYFLEIFGNRILVLSCGFLSHRSRSGLVVFEFRRYSFGVGERKLAEL
jgi:hypothetical protein